MCLMIIFQINIVNKHQFKLTIDLNVHICLRGPDRSLQYAGA